MPGLLKDSRVFSSPYDPANKDRQMYSSVLFQSPIPKILLQWKFYPVNCIFIYLSHPVPNVSGKPAKHKQMIYGIIVISRDRVMSMPLKKPSSLLAKIILLNTSIIWRNSNGDRGNPCLSPLPALKNLVGEPFTRTA